MICRALSAAFYRGACRKRLPWTLRLTLFGMSVLLCRVERG